TLCESQRLLAWLERQPWPHIEPRERGEAIDTLLEAACQVTRYVLCEPGLEIRGLERHVAQKAGAQRVARAYLTGSLEDTRATLAGGPATATTIEGLAARGTPEGAQAPRAPLSSLMSGGPEGPGGPKGSPNTGDASKLATQLGADVNKAAMDDGSAAMKNVLD